MAKRRNPARHHRRGRFVFLYKVLSMLVICGAIIAALTLFFRVDTVVATGQERYSPQEVCEASGVVSGDNLLLFNKYEVAGAIISQLPYIEEVRIDRKLPDTLLIEVKECAKPMAILQDGKAWLVSTKGKIVDCISTDEAREDYGIISGCRLLDPAVGTKMALATEYSAQQDSLLELLAALKDQGVLEKVDGTRLDDLSTLYMDYDGRFTVKLPYGADYAFKLRALRTYIEDTGYIQDNMTGTFDMQSDEDNTYFKQNVR